MNRRFGMGRVGSTCRCFNCAGVARLGRGLGLASFRASHFGNGRLIVMSLVWLVVEVAEGAGNDPVVASSLFEDTGFTDRQPDHFPYIW
jgi:hypothetical protein